MVSDTVRPYSRAIRLATAARNAAKAAASAAVVQALEAERDALSTLGGALADIEGVAEAYSVTGEWDFVAIVRVREHDELAEVVTQRLTKLEGIERTQTMVAFQQCSAHDLEAMFGLGLEDKKG